MIKKEQLILATSLELKSLADERISEAEILSANAKHEGVFYLAGYAIEFALKVVICERLDAEIFDKSLDGSQRYISQKALNAFMTHNLKDLLTLSGLRRQLEKDKKNNDDLVAAWSEVANWSEERRYDFGCTERAACDFLNDSKILLAWIRQYW